MSAEGKADILALVADSGLPKSRALAQLRLPRSTYYRWLKRLSEGRLKDKKGGSPIPWNKVRPEEETRVLSEARAYPELSCRQLALTITDSNGAYLSESTVYRILKRAGLIKPAEIIGFKAAKEYRRKTKQPNELWATDCCHLKVMGWGWYYLVSVMDDCSRFILAWDLKVDMAGASLEDVVQQAVDFTGMTDVPLEDRTVLLSDNGAGYISQQFNEYLRLVGIKHITASPFHPQTKDCVAYCTSYASFDSILNSGCRSRFHLPLTGAFSSRGSKRRCPLSLYALARNSPRQCHFFTVSPHTPRMWAIS
jgi:transposase InsO family protein